MHSRDILLLVGLIAPCICKRAHVDQWADQQSVVQDEIAHDEIADNEENIEDDFVDSGENSARGKIGLIVVDVQDCFTIKGLGLGNPRGGNDYKTKVNGFVEKFRKSGGVIVMLQDYHPKQHISFGNVALQDRKWEWNPVEAEFWEGKLCKDALKWDNSIWYKKDRVDNKFKKSLGLDFEQYLPMKGKCDTGGNRIKQPLFPAHCVQETDEVRLISGLCESAGGRTTNDTCVPGRNKKLKIVRKGMNPGIDSFGGVHDNRVVEGLIEDSNEKAHWGLLEFFQAQGVEHVIHIGIADDFCVKTTAFAVMGLGKAKYGIKSATVVPSLSYGIFQQLADREDAGGPFGAVKADQGLIKEYKDNGVKIETEEDALARLGHMRSRRSKNKKDKNRSNRRG